VLVPQRAPRKESSLSGSLATGRGKSYHARGKKGKEEWPSNSLAVTVGEKRKRLLFFLSLLLWGRKVDRSSIVRTGRKEGKVGGRAFWEEGKGPASYVTPANKKKRGRGIESGEARVTQ